MRLQSGEYRRRRVRLRSVQSPRVSSGLTGSKTKYTTTLSVPQEAEPLNLHFRIALGGEGQGEGGGGGGKHRKLAAFIITVSSQPNAGGKSSPPFAPLGPGTTTTLSALPFHLFGGHRDPKQRAGARGVLEFWSQLSLHEVMETDSSEPESQADV